MLFVRIWSLLALSSRLVSAIVSVSTPNTEQPGTSLSPLSANDIMDNIATNSFFPSETLEKTTSNLAKSIVFRSTNEQDIPLISDLLSYEVIVPTKSKSGLMTQVNNWASNMQKLKCKASFTTQLQHRRNVINVGSKVRSQIINSMEEAGHEDFSTNRIKELIYANDNFRHVLERAVHTSTDFEDTPQTYWDNHNFALQPPSDSLNHVMVSAFDPDLYPYDSNANFDEDALVGFCEVAMLPAPLEKACDDDSTERSLTPCITNLVVSPNHRRRGIASKMLRHMIRYSQIHFIQSEGDSVGLYVDKENHAAISLYEREGFVTVAKCDKVKGQIYMKYQGKE